MFCDNFFSYDIELEDLFVRLKMCYVAYKSRPHGGFGVIQVTVIIKKILKIIMYNYEQLGYHDFFGGI